MKIYNSIRTCVYLALTALVLVFVNKLAEIEYLRYAIGSLMIFYGIEEILFVVFNSKKHYDVRSLYWNIVEIAIGIIMIVFVENGDADVTYAVVCVAWATWSILRETRELVEATLEFKEKKTAIPDIVESLVVIGFSISMIVEPTEHHAKIHLYLLAVELATKVLFPLIDYIIEKVILKKKAGAAIADAPEVSTEVIEENGETVIGEGEVATSDEDENENQTV